MYLQSMDLIYARPGGSMPPGEWVGLSYFVGVDPSLRHGSVIQTSFYQDAWIPYKFVIASIYRLASWGKANGCPPAYRGVGTVSSIDEVVTFSKRLAVSVEAVCYPEAPVSIDWAPGALFAKSSPKLASYMSVFMGIFYSELESPKTFVHPSTLRSAIGVKPQSDKLEVHKAFANIIHSDKPSSDFIKSGALSEDEMDALILSAYPLISQRKTVETHDD